MQTRITIDELVKLGLNHQDAKQILKQLDTQPTPELAWHAISTEVLASYPFNIHLFLFLSLFPHWHESPETAPAWIPSEELISSANITQFRSTLDYHDVKTFHQWTVDHYQDFWPRIVDQLKIIFDKKPKEVCDLTQGVESPIWFPGAKLNITNSCFIAQPTATAIIYEDEKKQICKMTYGELNDLSNQIANSLVEQGYAAGDAIGIAMPMNQFAIACYLGIVKMGGAVVSIADSFSTQEIATRLSIANAKAIFTQDFSLWASKKLPLYQKVQNIHTPEVNLPNIAAVKIIVIPIEQQVSLPLSKEAIAWGDFLSANKTFTPLSRDSMNACNILFSSGTTGIPKAIVWNHTTAIKAASDAFFHQNIQAGDVMAWPTNLGWMMGPWLIFAAFINQACIALYTEAPKDEAFGQFVERAKVNMLGVVPTLVASWRETRCMENVDWSAIKVFSSTGECSNPEDMLYLMSLAGYKPVIEYCGGTEIGGAYLSSTVIENNYPSLFSTPTMGLDIAVIGEDGKPSNLGEVAIIPPSLGLSTVLLNADHYHVYFEGMPTLEDGKILRRHGDQVKRYPNGYYSILGRVDDTMKLGGIKISAAEIERTLSGFPHVVEVAAVAIQPPDNGPSQLIIYVSSTIELDKPTLMKEMQKKINSQLNPLFKIHDIIFTNELPKTASNKIMRRILRKKYQEEIH